MMQTNSLNQMTGPVWVLKIGGSLLGSAELHLWLDVIVKNSDGLVIIVPGGGVFADAVRLAQQRSGIDDKAAHRLALLAMDQFGLLLTALNPQIKTASTELEIAEQAWQHRAIVWLPSHMLMADETIAQNWAVTSDSLSAWLANQIGAHHLVIIKSVAIEPYQMKRHDLMEDLIADEVIDTQMNAFIKGQAYQTWLLNKQQYGIFEDGFSAAKLQEHGLPVNKRVD